MATIDAVATAGATGGYAASPSSIHSYTIVHVSIFSATAAASALVTLLLLLLILLLLIILLLIRVTKEY